MKLVLLALSLLTLTACSNGIGIGDNGYPQTSYVEPALNEHYIRFAEYAEEALGRSIPMGPITVSFASLGYTPDKGGMNGRCTTGGNMAPRVEIDQTFWMNADDSRRENLMFHELGHCILGRGHLEDKDQYGVPVSIMYPYTLSSSLYASRRSNYINELYKNSKYNSNSFADSGDLNFSSFVHEESGTHECATLTESRLN